ncbi:MAG TPA: ABC transporter permease [Longimicrobiales bacterium]|nr:ABC transporter permease [Longimicrobiales bacterium]
MSAGWWFARCLRLLPASLRREYGEDMAITFAARLAAVLPGRRARWAFLARELGGLVWLASTERLAWRRAVATATSDRQELSGMEHLTRELRHAVRRLGSTPGFTAAAILTLALAIGANTAIFALLHRVVLSPLPYPDAGRLVALDHGAPGLDVPSGLGMTSGFYREYGELPAVETLALYRRGAATLSGEGPPERLAYVQATPSLTKVLRVQPSLGRWFAESEGAPEGALVVVLSHSLWVSRFGADPGVIGRTTRIDGAPYEIIGVMPESFAFPSADGRFFIAQKLDPAAARPGGFNYEGIARIQPGVTLDALSAQFSGIIARLPERFPEHAGLARSMVDEARLTARPIEYKASVLRGVDQTLWVLLGAVAIVLLIACANLANLFLVRTDGRQREVAVRRALGAGSGKVAGFYFSETLVVAVASALIGLLLAYAAVQLLVARAPVALPRLHEIRLDTVAAGYALLLGLVSGASFAILPLLRRQTAPAVLLQDGGRGNTAGARRMHARQVLMGAQVSLAVMLLVAAALMIQSFRAMQRIDPGFRAESRLVFRIGLPENEYDRERASAFHERLLERLNALPGVASAAVTTTLPLDGHGWGDPLDVQGMLPPPGVINPVAALRRVTPAFFATIGVPLRQGRALDETDMRGHSNAAVVNEALAAAYFPDGQVIGRRVRAMGQEDGGWFTIVGVVGNTATHTLREDASTPKIYFPLRTEVVDGTPPPHAVSYVVHTGGPPVALVSAVRRLLDELDPNLAIARPEPLEDMVARSGATLAFTMVLLVLAGAVALLLGMIGVYAVIAYAVAQRTAEIGLRLALGARPGDVTTMIVRQSGAVIAAGVLIGLAGAAGGARTLGGLLFGVTPYDLPTFVGVAAGLFGTALLASWLPAQRAARQNPLESLYTR